MGYRLHIRYASSNDESLESSHDDACVDFAHDLPLPNVGDTIELKYEYDGEFHPVRGEVLRRRFLYQQGAPPEGQHVTLVVRAK